MAKTNGETSIEGFEITLAAAMEPTFVVRRIFDAPGAKVFKAWTDPQQIMHWWRPEDFTIPVCEMDVRPGGAWRIVMRSAQGVDYPLKGVFQEVAQGRRLVYTQNWEEHPAEWHEALRKNGAADKSHETLNTVTFDEQNGKTLVTIQTIYDSESVRAAMLKMGMAQEWSNILGRLEESLRQANEEHDMEKIRLTAEPGKQEFTFTRVFDAPREKVFKAYTDKKLIPQWWGPKRYVTAIDKMDTRPGGIWRFVQRADNGREFAFNGVYHAVEPPKQLVDTFEFEGSPGRVSLETVTLEELNGKTRLTGKSVFQSVEDRDGMLKSGMEEGLTETMGRLAGLLAEI